MGPMPVVVVPVFREDGFEMAAAHDEEPVQALPVDGADKPLGDRVGVSRQQHPIQRKTDKLSV